MLLIYIAAVIVVVLGILFFFMTKVYKIQPRPHRDTPTSLGIAFEEVRFKTKNDLNLHGWWIANEKEIEKPVLILVHGWKRNVERMLPYINILHEQYNLLAFDSRCHGSSDADNYSSMPRFAEDIRAAVDYVFSCHRPASKVGVIGLSMGGAAAIYAASKDERIQCVVTVGAFAHPAEVMRLEFKKRHIPYFPLVWLLFEYIQYIMKNRFDHIAPVNNIHLTRASMLLIHGMDDQTAPVEQAERLFKAAHRDLVELWLIAGKGHSNCHDHVDFKARLLNFLKTSLK